MERINFGIIGVGYFGKHFARLVQENEGALLRAVATRTEPSMALGEDVKRYKNYKELLADSEIGAVIIATPPSLHAQMIQEAISAGKHVLVEKPFVTNLADAEHLAGIVKKSDRVFMIGHQYLYNDHIHCLKEELGKGAIGSVKYFFAEHQYFGILRNDIGCFWETATHELAILDYLLNPGEVVSSTGQASGIESREDFVSAGVKFASGLSGSIFVSWFQPEKIRRMTFSATQGTALFDDRAEKKLLFRVQPYPAVDKTKGSFFFDPKSEEIKIPEIRAKEPLKAELAHFIESIQKKKIPRTDIEHGLRVTRMLDSISKSLKQV